MRLTKPLILFFILFQLGDTLFSQVFKQDSIVSISGQVYSGKSLEPVAKATLSIKRSRKGTICDSIGIFHLQVMQNDTLIISALGYKVKEWPVPLIFNSDFPPFFRIKLESVSYLLNEVDIYALGTWEEFKDEFVKTKLKEKNPINKDIKKQLAPFSTKKPSIIPAQYRPKRDKKMGVIDAIFKPTDFLYDKFSKSEKAKKRIAKRIRNEEKNKKISKKYNADIVSEATGLKGDELILFMEYCGSKIMVNENTSDYEVVKQILELFEKYTTTKE